MGTNAARDSTNEVWQICSGQQIRLGRNLMRCTIQDLAHFKLAWLHHFQKEKVSCSGLDTLLHIVWER